jgi:hypothetical protein
MGSANGQPTLTLLVVLELPLRASSLLKARMCSQGVESLENAIQHLFLEPNNEARTIEEEDVVEQLNAELQATTNETSRNKPRPQRITRAPPKRYL